MKFKPGDRVRVSCDGDTAEGVLIVTAANGRSLCVAWDDGMCGGYVGMMPILLTDSGEYRALISDRPVTLERLP